MILDLNEKTRPSPGSLQHSIYACRNNPRQDVQHWFGLGFFLSKTQCIESGKHCNLNEKKQNNIRNRNVMLFYVAGVKMKFRNVRS